MPRTAVKLMTCFVLTAVLASVACANQYQWSGVERVVALSDPHGAYDAMVKTLQNADVIDASRNWSGGTTHLVITGDLMDRGNDSRKIMDLVMQLETQAVQQGGMVHLTLGNHEVMNLVGDLRYVSRAEFAAFASEESAAERERWFEIFLAEKRNDGSGEADVAALRDEFERERPAGFYAHRRAFGSYGKYGRWLLQKPLLVVVNDTAFVHGGLPPLVAELGIERLNDELRAQVNDYVIALETLQGNGLIDPGINFYQHATVAELLATDAGVAAELRAALDTVIRLNEAVVHDSAGPLWYRGTVSCSALVESDVLADSLAAVGASRVVVGHTPTVTRHVLSRFDGRVIEIDTGMLTSSYRGSGNALVLEGTTVSVVNEAGRQHSQAVPHPRRVGARADDLDENALRDILLNAPIVGTKSDAAGRTIVELERAGRRVSAWFVSGPRRGGTDPELAAYRLDNMLQLDIVPATVSRDIDGRRGTLQFLPENARDESVRAAAGQGGGAWCPLQRQWNAMYVFDALIGNEGRAPSTMLYSPEDWQLMSMQHTQAFATRSGRPKYLADTPLELSAAWIAALDSLSDARLREQLGDVLDKRRLAALGKRRDQLLSEAGSR